MEPATPTNTLAELQRKVDQLSLEKNQYLDDLSNAEIFKMQLRETRKDAKHLSKQKKRLQAMADIEGTNETSEPCHENYTSQPENQVPPEINLSTSNETLPELLPPQAFNSVPPRQESLSLHSQESFPPPPPPHGFSMSSQTSPTLPAPPPPNMQRAPEWGVLDANAKRIENLDLVRIKRKQEEQIHNLVQEVATLETRCKEVESIARRLEAENQRLSLQVSHVHVGQAQSYNLGPHEEIQLLRAQLKVYEDDFKKERSEREHLNTQKERLKRELQESQATVAGLQRQLKQALTGEGGYGEPRDPPRAPIMTERYYDPYTVRQPLDYGIARAYSGGYIGPGASNDVLRRGQVPYVRKAFLSPDMTAVIDRDVTDGKRAPKSI